MHQPKILIATLYTGENELPACIESVRKQTYNRWQHQIFKNLPNKQANNTLYNFFQNHSGDFDLFIRLDADMVFRDKFALEKIVKLFQQYPAMDHAELAVRDCFSNTLIMGLHVYTSQCRWNLDNDKLFVDIEPSYQREKNIFWKSPAPLVDHAPDPSEFQAFCFGVHRCLKAFQFDRWIIDYPRAILQWNILKNTWKNFEYKKDRRLGWAILGAEEVIKNRMKPLEKYLHSPDLDNAFRKLHPLTSEQIYTQLKNNWSGKIFPYWRHKKSIFYKFPFFLTNKVYQKFRHGCQKTKTTRK